MKSRIIPVVFTAAVTSVATLFLASRFVKSERYLIPEDNKSVPVSYVNYGNTAASTAAALQGRARGRPAGPPKACAGCSCCGSAAA
jgi:hypothetical protein